MTTTVLMVPKNDAGKEGSRGGKVIGHTKSGKPIYFKASHKSHKTFSIGEHREAQEQHESLWGTHGEENNRDKEKWWALIKKKGHDHPDTQAAHSAYSGSADKAGHHHNQMEKHRKAANKIENAESRKVAESAQKDLTPREKSQAASAKRIMRAFQAGGALSSRSK